LTESNIFLEEFPEGLAAALNIDTFTAGIILSLFVIMLCILPIIIAKRGRSNFITEMIIGVVAVSLCMALQWLPLYVGLVINLLVAIALSAKLRDWMG